MKMDIKSSQTWMVRIITAIAGGIFVVSCGTALIFELDMHYGDGCKMPLIYGYLLIYLSLFVLQFSFATLAIKCRFSCLNYNLGFTFLNPSTKCTANSIHVRGYTEPLPNIITDLYSILCDAIDLVNDSFTFQLIPFMVYYLTANLFAIYSLVREAYFKTPLMYIAIGTNIWWIILHTAIISIALYSSYTTTKCAIKTPVIVSSIIKSLNWKQSPDIVETFKTFLLEVQYRNMFLENEFFRVDWKLLFSVSRIVTFVMEKFLIDLLVSSLDDLDDHNFSCYNLPVRCEHD